MKRILKLIIVAIFVVMIIISINKKDVYVDNLNSEEITQYVYPMGNVVGIKANTEGVLVIGYEEEDVEYIGGIKIGDRITSINDMKINNANDVSKALDKIKSEEVIITYERDGAYKKTTLKTKKEGEKYKLGLWIRDKVSGVGTMTFYDPKDNKFYALGHSILDYDTKEIINIKEGYIYEPISKKINKSNSNKIGSIEIKYSEDIRGNFNVNSNYGISGNLVGNKDKDMNMLEVGDKEQIKEGEAIILFEDENRNITSYDIVIKEVIYDNEKYEDMIIEVVDKSLIEYSGGIVQGMSGCPIIQDNKIIGAITHVFKDNPQKGYGICIDKMIK